MTYAEQLKRTYVEARGRIIAQIEQRIRWGKQYCRESDLLRLIDKELGKLGVDTARLQGVQVQTSFLSGAETAYKAARNDAMPSAEAFAGLHQTAIRACVRNAQSYAKIAAGMIARQADDRVRALGLDATTRKLTQNLTWQEQRRELEALLTDDGFLTVPWRNGKGCMRLDSYAELVARTTTNEATTTGLLAELAELGEGLVKMTTFSPTCAVCACRQGRVYRTMDYPKDDERNGFPHISQGLPRWPTYKTVHPNCRHRLMPYIWTEKSRAEQEAALGRAGDSFESDPRAEKEIEAYRRAQDVKRRRLADRKQWERYRDVLGEGNVPTFSGFRRMKQAGSERYTDMQSDYRYALKVMRKDDILLTKYVRRLPISAETDCIKDLVDDLGQVKQRRIYGLDGHPIKDIDTSNHGNAATHPMGRHAHDWMAEGRGRERPLTEQEQRQNKDIWGGDDDAL